MVALEASQFVVGGCRSVLAAPAGRKLAVLIGIDDYPKVGLKGCLTDVALQENLLVHRFGFLPQNIFKLTNQAATESAVTQLFANELQQLRPHDLVVIHFSGKGGIALNRQPMLMMADGSTISWETLERLCQTCPTQRIVTVLDTSFRSTGQRMQGNLRVRSALQDRDDQQPHIPVTHLPGILLTASPLNQLNAQWDAQWDDRLAFEVDYADFSAGQFTYALTRALWQSAAPQFSGTDHHPAIATQQQDLIALETMLGGGGHPAAVGAITTVDTAANTSEVWLGGMAAHQLATLTNQSVLRSADGQQWPILARQGLKAKVRHQTTGVIGIGTALQEQIRVIAQNLPLEIAIATTVPKIERVDAISALANLPQVTTKLVGEGRADYLLAKIPQPNTVVAVLPDAVVTDVLPSALYGLFAIDQPPRPIAAGRPGEAITATMKRVSPIVQSLYAAKLLSLLENQASSGMAVGMRVDLLKPEAKLLLRQTTTAMPVTNVQATPIPIDSQLHCQLLAAAQPYWLLVGWDSRHAMDIFVPAATVTTFDSIAREPGGEMVVYLIASDRPFTQTWNQLAIDRSKTIAQMLPQPLPIMQTLMQDLAIESVEGNYRFDVDRYAVIRLQYQLV